MLNDQEYVSTNALLTAEMGEEPVRKPFLVLGLLCTFAVLSTQQSSLRAAEAEVVPLSEVDCSKCALLIYPHVPVVRLEAESIAIDQATGAVRLVGAVHVKFRDGRELQALSMIMKVTSQGLNEFRGDGMRMAPNPIR